MSTSQNKVVVITGASSGIGEALAREWFSRGSRLVLLARRKERLESLAQSLDPSGARVLVCQGDVTSSASLKSAFEAAIKKFSQVDIVVANAGFGVVGPFDKLNVDDFKRQFDTNVYGVLNTIYAGIDALKQSQGHLVLIGSVAGYVTLSGSLPYAMSKHAIRALADGLWQELHPFGVSVTLVSPGFVESDIRRTNNQGEYHADAKDPYPSWLVMPRKVAARQIVRATTRRRREIVVTHHGKLAAFLIQHFRGMILLLLRSLKMGSRGEPARQ